MDKEHIDRFDAVELGIRRVLIVDDEIDYLKVLGQLVSSEGLQVFTSPTGEEALEKCEKETFDAILCDLQLKGIPGLEFIGELRKKGLDVPVVVLSGFPDRDNLIDAMRLGAIDFLEKPFEAFVLRAVIMRAVEIGVRRRRLDETLYKAVAAAQGSPGTPTLEKVKREKKMLTLMHVLNHSERKSKREPTL